MPQYGTYPPVQSDDRDGRELNYFEGFQIFQCRTVYRFLSIAPSRLAVPCFFAWSLYSHPGLDRLSDMFKHDFQPNSRNIFNALSHYTFFIPVKVIVSQFWTRVWRIKNHKQVDRVSRNTQNIVSNQVDRIFWGNFEHYPQTPQQLETVFPQDTHSVNIPSILPP